MPAARSRPTARAAAAAPLRARVLDLPSLRSLVAGALLFVACAGAYLAARDTSVFAVRTIEVRGAEPQVRRQVLRALAEERGVSLLRIDGGLIDRRVASVPWVVSATFDRAFPASLVVTVRTERPVAVLRRGPASWLVSARGRVLEQLRRGEEPALPRIWVGPRTSVTVGATLADAGGGRAARALAPLRQVRFRLRVTTVRAGADELTFRLRSGLELRFGDAGDLRLKLAVARRILAGLGPVGPGDYVDVSVPERPVALVNPPVAGRA